MTLTAPRANPAPPLTRPTAARPTPLRLRRARPVEGAWEGVDCSVRWRFGRVGDARSPGAAARAWIRDLVREHDLFEWRGFAETARGVKPRLDTDAPVDASLSHRRGFVLVAVAVATGVDGDETGADAVRVRVGADLEVAPYDAFESPSLVRRMLTREEERRVRLLTPDDRRAALVRIWTAKEAFVKATGEGLARDFRGFVAPETEERPEASVEACVVVAAGDAPLRCFRPTLSASD
ncbi:4'-phosphopantetheinyl transferase superfamily protein [Agromyces protaetiae]|uniref:4'-phosphopantetheinyl transferase superfamily protein n=1 Tax=Agromyces protaetiae TaxID=2509455 RepID=A0A4P6FFG2_9MICO|nr:4'-phosphopantetheinyl transferase superfamily protein [Agromyces protaetiae]QAY74694.1 4'-phosphopantetheinyl transferase superfamily protein [Agromyces protaetiae]